MICNDRRHVTLIEIMIVLFLIALIAGVVAYNYRGTLDEGRAFETKQNINKIHSILDLELAKNPQYKDIEVMSKWRALIWTSSLAKDPKQIVKDGWGDDIQLQVNPDGTLRLYSTNPYCKDHPDSCPTKN